MDRDREGWIRSVHKIDTGAHAAAPASPTEGRSRQMGAEAWRRSVRAIGTPEGTNRRRGLDPPLPLATKRVNADVHP